MMRTLLVAIGFATTTTVAGFGPSGGGGQGMCAYFTEIPSFCTCNVAHAYGAAINCDTSMVGVSFDAKFEFEPCDTKPHISCDVSAAGCDLFTYDISSGEDGQVDIPGLDVSLGIVSAGAVLKYKFDIVNDGKGETNLNVKLKMDACGESMFGYEECGEDLMPSLLPMTLFDEAVDIGNVCGGGGGGGNTPGGGGGGGSTQCTSDTDQCTSTACSCPAGSAKKEFTFGNPSQICWSCEAGQSSYDDDDQEYAYHNDATYDDDDDAWKGPAPAPGRNQLENAVWYAKDGSDASFSKVQHGDHLQQPSAFAPRAAPNGAGARQWHIAAWDQLKHAGWNEPCNRYKSKTEFYINTFVSNSNSPHSMDELKLFHAGLVQEGAVAKADQ